jgi:hypothetical protein
MPSQEKLCTVTIRLHEDAVCDIRGYGIPYRHAGDPILNDIINADEPFHRGQSLMDIFLRATKFRCAVMTYDNSLKRVHRIPPPFSYPYGDDHSWDVEKYRNLLIATRSTSQFTPVHQYDDNNSFVAVATQFNVQDGMYPGFRFVSMSDVSVLWLDEAARHMATEKFGAYFVRVPGQQQMAYVIVALSKDFREDYDMAWRRLTKNVGLTLLVHDMRDVENREDPLELYVPLHAYPALFLPCRITYTYPVNAKSWSTSGPSTACWLTRQTITRWF